MENTKSCKTCGDTKSLTEFRLAKLGKLGREAHCKECEKLKRIATLPANSEPHLKDTKWFINKSTIRFPGRFSYNSTVYTYSIDPIILYCNTCNKEFTTTAHIHLRKGSNGGCRTCKVNAIKSKQRKSLAVFIEEGNEAHNGKYTYTNTMYVNDSSKVIITCPIHGDFTQQAGSHIGKSKCGCPLCANDLMGFSGSIYEGAPAILYCVEVDTENGLAYKVGITKRDSVLSRYSYIKDKEAITKVVFQASFLNGRDSYDIEKHLLKHFGKSKYAGTSPFHSTGITEILTVNPTKYIQQYIKDNYGKK